MEKYDLGSGHSFSWLGAHERTTPYSTTWPDGVLHENLVGIIEWHTTASGGESCGGSVLFEGADDDTTRPHWQVVSLDPLELAPSIQCTQAGCGSHGYIRGGRWTEA